jgi:PPP family 3-phenylpropionic acid transporter
LPRVRQADTLRRFLALYGGLFAAFGVASPFLPALLVQDGLTPSALGIVLAGGTGIRLLAGPFGGRLADRARRPSLVLAGFTAAAAVIATGYAPARGLPLLFLVSVAHATVLAPITPVADALALGSATMSPIFSYGWVRGAGSAAFIAGVLLAGQAVEQAGLGIIIWLNAGLLALAAMVATRVPDRLAGSRTIERPTGGWPALLGIPVFVRLMVVASLIGGSHAMHDGFEVIRWRAAGLSETDASILWSSSVAAEIVMFVVAGPWLLRRFGPANALRLSAAAGVLRWAAAASTASFPIMALVEPLHGFTFALLHLACMDLIGRAVPRALAATAQAIYATFAMGIIAALVTLAAGPLYGTIGPAAFWPMAAMCGLAFALVRQSPHPA